MAEVGGVREVIQNLDRWQDELLRRARQTADEIAIYLESYAKSHHRWKPVTGATDVSTQGTWEELRGEVFRVVLSAGMDYDVFLELARGGRWAWLWPAIEENRDQIMQMWQRGLEF
jgi:hypothetical protein